MGRALLIIDVQNFYFEPDRLKEPLRASANARRILDRFREQGLPVFHIRHGRKSSRLSDKLLEDIHESVKPLEGEIIITKHTPGSFKGTDLLDQLKTLGVDELVICGMMSHMCVDTTTREAFDFDFKNTVIHDACTTRELIFLGATIPAEYVHATAMAALAFAFAKVVSCEEYLAQN